MWGREFEMSFIDRAWKEKLSPRLFNLVNSMAGKAERETS